jgi:hypothetical protein
LLFILAYVSRSSQNFISSFLSLRAQETCHEFLSPDGQSPMTFYPSPRRMKMASASFTNTYLVTNRKFPTEQNKNYIYPLPTGQLYFFTAPGQYNSNANAYQQVNSTPTKIIPTAFATKIEKDIKIAIANGCPQISVYIHGLDNYFSDTCNELGTYGANLLKQGYKGLLIGFDWPSYGAVDSYFYYASKPYRFPPTATNGTIRDNINGSVQSFRTLLSILAGLCRKYNVKLNLICHSEGNYMLMLGLNKIDFTPTPFMNRILLLAADINSGALQSTSFSRLWSGQLSTVNTYALATTVYWSSHDDALPSSDGWTEYHNPQYPKRLGLHGLFSNKPTALIPTAYGLDCSLVVNKTVMNKTGVPPSVSVHSSYFYIPQVLLDMTQTLNGVAPAKVTNRVSAGNQTFTMKLASSLLTGPLVPSGERLKKQVPKAKK